MALNEKGVVKINTMVSKLGARETGIKLININLSRLTGGMSSDDLPDDMTYANGLDSVNELLNSGEYESAWEVANETASEMISNLGYGDMFEGQKKQNKMKRVKFKKELPSINETLKLVPNKLKNDGQVFEMTDGNKTVKIRWEGSLTEGVAIPILLRDNNLISEDTNHMKHLMGYKTKDNIGTHKSKGRLMENDKFKELLNFSKKKTLVENSGAVGVVNIVDEAEVIEESLKGIMAGVMSLIGGVVSGQEIPQEKIQQVKTELSQLSPQQKEVVGNKLTPEQVKQVADVTGISFTDSGANSLFQWDPETDAKRTQAPKLYLGKYGDINAAKVVDVDSNGKGGHQFTVKITGVYSYGTNFSKIRAYIGKNNTKLNNTSIQFVNDEGSPYSGKDISYR